jgi:uncharacterized pyridoxal phosphate-containing UPF0001 family protein
VLKLAQVDELLEKAPKLPGDIEWHFIGHLQSNKAKRLAELPNLAMLESLDSERLARTLNAALAAKQPNRRLPVLIQVNTSGEQCELVTARTARAVRALTPAPQPSSAWSAMSACRWRGS